MDHIFEFDKAFHRSKKRDVFSVPVKTLALGKIVEQSMAVSLANRENIDFSELPDPHPLDYDWRFTNKTIANVKELIKKNRVLLLGCPSLGLALHSNENEVTIVDRQPLFFVPDNVNFICTDLRFNSLAQADLGAYDVVIFDSPWYVDYIFDWLQEACCLVKDRGTIYFSLWPPETRTYASDEISALRNTIQQIGSFEKFSKYLHYETPRFEQAVAQHNGKIIPNSWRRGDLVKLTVHNRTALSKKIVIPPRYAAISSWHRFVIGKFQLALRVNGRNCDSEPRIIQLFDDNIPPTVSRRLDSRDLIDIWTSDGHACGVEGASYFLQAIQHILSGNLDTKNHRIRYAAKLIYQYKLLDISIIDRVYQWQHLS